MMNNPPPEEYQRRILVESSEWELAKIFGEKNLTQGLAELIELNARGVYDELRIFYSDRPEPGALEIMQTPLHLVYGKISSDELRRRESGEDFYKPDIPHRINCPDRVTQEPLFPFLR